MHILVGRGRSQTTFNMLFKASTSVSSWLLEPRLSLHRQHSHVLRYPSARICAGFPYTELMPMLLSSLAHSLTSLSSLSMLRCSAAALLFHFAFLFSCTFTHVASTLSLTFFISDRPAELVEISGHVLHTMCAFFASFFQPAMLGTNKQMMLCL